MPTHDVKKKGKNPSWMGNRAHEAQKRKHESYDRQKRKQYDESKEDYKKALIIFTSEQEDEKKSVKERWPKT